MQDLLSKRLRLPLGRWRWDAPLWALLLALAVVALFARLGHWQLDRALEKAAITERHEARRDLSPLALPDLLARGGDIEELPLRLRGHFDNSRTFYLENQPRGPRAGFHVITPFLPAGERDAILVNRGWIPAGRDMQALPPVPDALATEIRGMVALPSPYFIVGEPDYRLRPLRVGRIEPDKISRALDTGLRPFLLRLYPAEPDGFVREWSPAARLGMPPAKHRAYAFQWFSLAAAVMAVLLVVNLHKNNKSEP
jgi:cytochrome oxidase assembly protein ShyY1